MDSCGNVSWSFRDGGSLTMVDGIVKLADSDGSYMIKDTNSQYFEVYNGEDGSHMVCNETGEVEILKINDEHFKFDYSNGKLNLLQDDEAGLTIIMNEDGTGKVYAPGKHYEITADGLNIEVTTSETTAQKPETVKPNTQEKGTWTLVSTTVGYTRESYSNTIDAELYTANELEHRSVYEYYLTSKTQHGEFVMRCERPPVSFKGGEILTLKATAHGEGGSEFAVETVTIALAPADADPDSLQGSYLFRKEDNDWLITVDSDGERPDAEGIFAKEAPKGRKDGEQIAIFFSSDGCYTRWIYEWSE